MHKHAIEKMWKREGKRLKVYFLYLLEEEMEGKHDKHLRTINWENLKTSTYPPYQGESRENNK